MGMSRCIPSHSCFMRFAVTHIAPFSFLFFFPCVDVDFDKYLVELRSEMGDTDKGPKCLDRINGSMTVFEGL